MAKTDLHLFFAADGAVCECGLVMWHETHFGGNRDEALQAYREMGNAITSAQQVYDDARKLKQVANRPVFTTMEEADAWLAQFEPEPEQSVPTFITVEEADVWMEREAARKRIKEATYKDSFRQNSMLSTQWMSTATSTPVSFIKLTMIT